MLLCYDTCERKSERHAQLISIPIRHLFLDQQSAHYFNLENKIKKKNKK